MDDLTAKSLMRAGLSRSYAHHVVAGTKTPTPALALWLLDKHGLTVPPLAGKTKGQIAALRATFVAAAPESVLRRLDAA